MAASDRQELVRRLLARKGVALGVAPSIGRRPAGVPPPMSFAQRRLWVVDQLEPASLAYHLTQTIRLRGALDVTALEIALAEIIGRHEALRCGFPSSSADEPLRVIETPERPLVAIDLTVVGAAERDARMEQVARDIFHAPIRLSEPPLWRLRLVKLDRDLWHLLIAVHHIVFDGWSLDIFVRELRALYEAFSQHRPSPLDDLPVQPGDYAWWQQQQSAAGAWADDLEYWERQLAGRHDIALAPDSRRRHRDEAGPDTRRPAGFHRFQWSPALTRATRAFAQRHETTPFVVGLAAFFTLLHRRTHQSDLIVGSPFANRHRLELEGLIGLFGNMVPLRLDLHGAPGFGELVRRIAGVTRAAHAHQEVPFEQIVERVQRERTLGKNPLFDIAFAYQAGGSRRWTLGDVEIELVPPAPAGAKFDLTVALEEGEDDVGGVVEYRADRFEPATIARMMGQYSLLLEGGLESPGTPIVDLPILVDADRAIAPLGDLAALATPGAPDVPGSDLCARFESVVRSTPGSIAVTFGDQTLTYAELDERANGIAGALRSAGAGPEQFVALFLDRTLDLVPAVLGVLKSGAAFVPIDPAYPPDRIGYIVADSGAAFVLTTRDAAARLDLVSGRVLCVEDLPRIRRAPIVAALPGRAAYVIYTSGSTGRPKGVVVSHANVVRLLDETAAWFAFDTSDVWTLFHSYAFDFSVWEMWGALLHGGRLVIVPYWDSRSVDRFYDLLVRQQVTVLNQTPSAFRHLMDEDQRRSPDGHARASPAAQLSLRYVIFGGEALDLASLAGWIERRGDRRPQLVNMYGITETTVHVTYRPILRADLDAGAGRVIGRPIPDLRIFLLDRRMNPVPIGVAGEIFVGGRGVARGYLGRPALTAERFVPDPFGSHGEVLYRSGDLARWLPDGDLEYLGRADHQIKVRGFRIEPGEIESALAGHPHVAASVVLAHAADGETRLTAYLVASRVPPSDPHRSSQPPTASDLRLFLQRSLPDYMMPARFVWLDGLPLTEHGKVDRRALRDPGDGVNPRDAFEPPVTEAERALAAAWATALGVDAVGATDNFFTLGGDSIRSIKARTLARARGFDFELADLFRFQTVRELAREGLKGEHGVDAGGDLESVSSIETLPVGAADAYPLAALQAGMLFHAAMTPGAGAYHDVFSFHVRLAWDQPAFERALDQVTSRHAVLRTSFAIDGFSQPRQIVWRAARIPLVVHDLRGRPSTDQDAEVERWIDAEASCAFDWTRPPLVRAAVHRRSADTLQLTFTVHHTILDGWSFSKLLTGLVDRYFAEIGIGGPATGHGAALDGGLTYRDFVALEISAAADPAARRFWEETLTDLQRLALPARREPLPADGPTGGLAVRTIHWSAETTARLKEMAARESASLKSTLLAIHVAVLASLAAQHDIVTGLVCNGRPEEEGADEILGLFLNTVPLRMNVAGATWADLVRLAFDAERRLLPYRRVPLAEMQKGHGGDAIFETAFNFVHFHALEPLLSRPDFALIGARYHESTSFVLFAQFSVEVATGGLQLALSIDDARLTAAQADEVAGYYRRALELLASRPDGRADAAVVLSDREQRLLLETFASGASGAIAASGATTETGRAADDAACLHELVERTIAARPECVAIVDGPRRVTYGELGRDMAAWAASLQAYGVGPDARVGVCLPRSADLIAALLAILKAGGTYVPLDAAYPGPRLAQTCRDTRPRLIITDLPEVEWRARVPDALPTIAIDALRATAGRRPPIAISPERPSEATPRNLAYFIYTSGSTGTPKAAAIEHASAVARVKWAQSVFSIEDLAGVLASTSIAFDLSVFEIFVTLASGGTLILAPHALALGNLPARNEVTLLNTVPSAAAELLRQDAIPASVRIVNLAGEPVTAALVEALYARPHIERVFDLYGPSEDTTYSTCALRAPGGVETIGRPLPGTRAYLLDPGLRLVPLGAAGELFLAGAGLARGYWDRPALTAERFLPDPFVPVPGSRMYRTGDVARWTPDGELLFLGRSDQQVKIRGYRIELGELRAALEALPSVQDAVVVTRTDDRRHALVAYVVPRRAQDLSAGPWLDALRDALGGTLPAYMIPTAWMALERLPRTPNGKLDRAALPAPGAGRGDGGPAFAEPLTDSERTMAAVWAEVLPVDRVGRDDNFFHLGGDSIMLLQIIARLQRLGLHCSARDVIEQQTIARLAARLLARAAPPQAPRPAGRATGPVRLGPIQEWFFAEHPEAPHHWNQSVLLEVRDPMEADVLAAALGDLVGHHDALRLRFSRRGSGWGAQVSPPSGHDYRFDRLSLLHDASSASGVADVCARAQASLDIEQGPMLRALLFDDVETGDARQRLFIAIHHLAVDGVSWRVLLDDLRSAYLTRRAGRSVELPDDGSSFAEWTGHLARAAGQGALDGEIEFWREQLDRGPALPLDLPARHLSHPFGSVETLTSSLGAAATDSLLRDVIAATGASINDVLITALLRTLAAWTGERSHLVAVEGHGRATLDESVDVGRTVGWFTSLFPLRLRLGSSGNLRDQLGRVGEQLRQVPRGGVGYGALRYLHPDPALRASLDAGAPPSITFNYLGQIDAALGGSFAPARESSGPQVAPAALRRHLLDANAIVIGGRLTIDWHFSTLLHRRSTIDALASAYLDALGAIIADAAGARAGSEPLAHAGVDRREIDAAIGELDGA